MNSFNEPVIHGGLYKLGSFLLVNTNTFDSQYFIKLQTRCKPIFLQVLYYCFFCISFINAGRLLDDDSDSLDEEALSESLLELLVKKRNYVASSAGFLTGGDGLRYFTKAGPNGSRIVFRIDLPGKYAITLPKDGLFLIPRDGLRDLIKSNGGSLE